MSGKRAFLDLLRQEGVEIVFGNPGTTELPLMDAFAVEHDIRYVLGLQEAALMAMADGYAQASGRLAVLNLHVAPGLGNAMGSLYNAQFTGTPMILTAGQQEQGHGLMEPVLYGPLVRMAEPFAQLLDNLVARRKPILVTGLVGPAHLEFRGQRFPARLRSRPGRRRP